MKLFATLIAFLFLMVSCLTPAAMADSDKDDRKYSHKSKKYDDDDDDDDRKKHDDDDDDDDKKKKKKHKKHKIDHDDNASDRGKEMRNKHSNRADTPAGSFDKRQSSRSAAQQRDRAGAPDPKTNPGGFLDWFFGK